MSKAESSTPTPLSQDAKAREMARELRGEHEHVLPRGAKTALLHDRELCLRCRAASALLSAHARMERMEKALRVLLEMCERANPGAFENGVRVEGSPDEGEVWADRTIEAARAALSAGKEGAGG